jgi:putative ABC transport system permease protein
MNLKTPNRVIKSGEKVLKEIDPRGHFEYTFLEDLLSSSYEGEQKLNLLFLVLSVIAIFISSLGLFGMATFTTQNRMPEIRKDTQRIGNEIIDDTFSSCYIMSVL